MEGTPFLNDNSSGIFRRLSTGRPLLTPEEAAARLDTEGSITISMAGPCIRVLVIAGCNNVKEYVLEMKEQFHNGWMYSGHDESGDPKWSFGFARKRDEIEFLTLVLPYLRIKREPAIVALKVLRVEGRLPNPSAKQTVLRKSMIAERQAFVSLNKKINAVDNIHAPPRRPLPTNRYAAAAFDGEGYVGIVPQIVKKYLTLQLSVTFSNNALNLTKDMQLAFSVKLRKSGKLPKDRLAGSIWQSRRKDKTFQWNLRSQYASLYLGEIYPYLRNKDLQAWIGMCYQQHIMEYREVNIGHALSAEEWSIRYDAQSFLKHLHFLDRSKSRASVFDFNKASKRATSLVARMRLSAPIPRPSAGRYANRLAAL